MKRQPVYSPEVKRKSSTIIALYLARVSNQMGSDKFHCKKNRLYVRNAEELGDTKRD